MKNNLVQEHHCGVRFLEKNDFNLDTQFVINTPVDEKSSVIEPHLDNPIEFFAGLLYMRNIDDNSEGGNLCTYKFKKDPIFYGKSRVKYDNVDLIEEIEYKPNRNRNNKSITRILQWIMSNVSNRNLRIKTPRCR